jgi:hypothetical protein
MNSNDWKSEELKKPSLPLERSSRPSSSSSSSSSLDGTKQMPRLESPTRCESMNNANNHILGYNARGGVSRQGAEANFVDVSLLRSRVGDRRVINKKATRKYSDPRSSLKTSTSALSNELLRKDSMNASITDDYLDSSFGNCDVNHSRASWETPRVNTSSFAGGGGEAAAATRRSVVDRDTASDALENSSDHPNLLSVETAVNIAKQENILSRKRRIRRGDNVLVAFKLMDSCTDGMMVTEERSSTQQCLTVSKPVNQYGFPQGEGIVEEQKRGPYDYVLATVKSIHFGEDAIYYVVERFDNKACQRAQRGKSSQILASCDHFSSWTVVKLNTFCLVGWMEAIEPGSEGEMAAMRAAQCTMDTIQAEGPAMNRGIFGCRACVIGCREAMKLAFQNVKRFVARQAELITSGQPPYRIQLRFTTVNLFVFCSLIVALLELFKFAFLPIEADNAIHVIVL